jgi:rod shape determining protein RodA
LNIIIKSLGIAKTSKDKFGKYMIIGIVTMLTFQILQNIGMDIGLMPITGIPLPFMSYGGSSLMTNVISIALVLNVGMRRRKIKFN